MTHEPLHSMILETVQTDIENYFLKEGIALPTKNQKEFLLKKIFKNFRRFKNGKQSGLRLSYIGNSLLAKHYEHHAYMHEDILTNHIILRLDQNMKWPYYISRTIAVFYSQDDAAWFKLNEGKLKDFVDYI